MKAKGNKKSARKLEKKMRALNTFNTLGAKSGITPFNRNAHIATLQKNAAAAWQGYLTDSSFWRDVHYTAAIVDYRTAREMMGITDADYLFA